MPLDAHPALAAAKRGRVRSYAAAAAARLRGSGARDAPAADRGPAGQAWQGDGRRRRRRLDVRAHSRVRAAAVALHETTLVARWVVT